ncbi:hypothetical protein C8Q80DRAFT_224199 [Daedaleopsis nitida]|nr:hypothetical protein C8Q80DRAFT_224199 [Daedaleopsis nitida]
MGCVHCPNVLFHMHATKTRLLAFWTLAISWECLYNTSVTTRIGPTIVTSLAIVGLLLLALHNSDRGSWSRCVLKQVRALSWSIGDSSSRQTCSRTRARARPSLRIPPPICQSTIAGACPSSVWILYPLCPPGRLVLVSTRTVKPARMRYCRKAAQITPVTSRTQAHASTLAVDVLAPVYPHLWDPKRSRARPPRFPAAYGPLGGILMHKSGVHISLENLRKPRCVHSADHLSTRGSGPSTNPARGATISTLSSRPTMEAVTHAGPIGSRATGDHLDGSTCRDPGWSAELATPSLPCAVVGEARDQGWLKRCLLMSCVHL